MNLMKAAFNVMAKYNTALISLERDGGGGCFNGGCKRETQKKIRKKEKGKSRKGCDG